MTERERERERECICTVYTVYVSVCVCVCVFILPSGPAGWLMVTDGYVKAIEPLQSQAPGRHMATID